MERPHLTRERVGALLLGVGSLAVLFRLDPRLPSPIAYLVVAPPIALCLYGVTWYSMRTVARNVGLVTLGLLLVRAVEVAGVL